ncbi:putative RNA-directed DNA polymerase from transposon X-element [Trichonephila clavipes]|nr:putative RNA-directed DNA polymerase from transposon X-element [Trichonephila clavipes]
MPGLFPFFGSLSSPIKCLKCAGPHEAKNCNRAFKDPLICATTIANDEGGNEELLARAFRAALRKLSHPDDKACEISQAYVTNEIASDIRHLSHARWEKTIEELSPETGALWRRTSFLKKPFHHIPSLKGALGSIVVAPIEKAEVIADSLQKQFEPNTDVENPRFSAHIQRKVQRFLDSPTCMDLEKTSPSEIQEFIKNFKPNKSHGIDLITNRILKNPPTKFIIFITLLFNMLLENIATFLKVGGWP